MVAVHGFGSKNRMSLNFPSCWRESQEIHSRATQEQLDHFTPPLAFDSENRATMTVNGFQIFNLRLSASMSGWKLAAISRLLWWAIESYHCL